MDHAVGIEEMSDEIAGRVQRSSGFNIKAITHRAICVEVCKLAVGGTHIAITGDRARTVVTRGLAARVDGFGIGASIGDVAPVRIVRDGNGAIGRTDEAVIDSVAVDPIARYRPTGCDILRHGALARARAGAGDVERRYIAVRRTDETVIDAVRIDPVAGDRVGRIADKRISSLPRACAGARYVEFGDRGSE